MYSTAEQEICLANAALEIPYYHNNIDRLVKKPEEPAEASDRTHFRGSAMEGILESVYEDDLEELKNTDGATEAMRKVSENLSIYPRPNTVPFTTLKHKDAARFRYAREPPLSASTECRRLYSLGRHNINQLPYAVDDNTAIEPKANTTKARASLPEPCKSPKNSQDVSFTPAPVAAEDEDVSYSEGLHHLPSPPLSSTDGNSGSAIANWPTSPTTEQPVEEVGIAERRLLSFTDPSALRWSLSSISTAENMVSMPYRRRALFC